MGIFDRLKASLTKTRQAFTERVETILHRRRIDEELFDELEETLLAADIGFETTQFLLNRMQKEARRKKLETADQLVPVLQEAILEILGEDPEPLTFAIPGPTVVLFVGVNGVGKTTTIGKLAKKWSDEGKKVVLAAGDTFRAAAIEQLVIWGERASVDVIRQTTGSDPAAVIFDAINAAKARKADILLCDTAGRLQNKANLMEELEKVYRIIARELPGAPHEVLLVLDATTGQNAITQAKLFSDVAKVTGIVLTKLDGTAKGGVVIGIKQALRIPVKWIGLGESIDDLQPFSAAGYAQALFSGATWIVGDNA